MHSSPPGHEPQVHFEDGPASSRRRCPASSWKWIDYGLLPGAIEMPEGSGEHQSVDCGAHLNGRESATTFSERGFGHRYLPPSMLSAGLREMHAPDGRPGLLYRSYDGDVTIIAPAGEDTTIVREFRKARPGARRPFPTTWQALSVSADRRSSRLAAQEAFAAINRPALGWLEGYRGFPTALRAGGHCFCFGKP